MSRSPRLGALACAVFAFTSACGGSDPTVIEGWSEASHGKSAAPDYSVVFAQNEVKRFDLTLAPADWKTMQDDMTAMAGAFGSRAGSGAGGGGAGGGGMPPGGGGMGGGAPTELTQPCVGKAAGDACTATFQGSTFTSTCAQGMGGAQLVCRLQGAPGGGGGGAPGGGAGGGNGGDILPNTPVYVPATFRFEGKTWPYIGVRFKGNSSLSATWGSGVSKLPLRLHFDKYEAEHPETEDQRFYGFKKLSLGNGAADPSLMRDKIVSDLFRESGVPAPRTAFVALYVDHGEGAQYWGLFTLDEDIDNDSFLDRSFNEHKGVLYEADGVGARWGAFDAASFEIQANEAQGHTPIQEAIAALQSDRTDAAAWRARLEAKLDVQGFLKWLALNTVLQNWDAYGAMAHNYYLYSHKKENGRLKWITWDHDRALGSTGPGQGTSLTYATTDATWPLIRYLLDDPTYKADYTKYALEAARGPAAPAALQARIREAQELITPYVVGANAEQQGYTFLTTPQTFTDAIQGTSGLLNFAARRQGEVEAALGANP